MKTRLSNRELINIKKPYVVVCDFDGVLTDNKVYVDQDGREMVCCSRADGSAFGLLKKEGVKVFIISTEKNPVVARRAKKMGVPIVYGVNDKLQALKKLSKEQGFSLAHVFYVGNDVNDSEAMSVCGWRVCPVDAYGPIKKIANIVLRSRGGDGVVRELVEKFGLA